MNRMQKLISLLVVMVVASAAIAGAFSIPGLGKAEKVKAVNDVVSIPVEKVNDGKTH